MLAQLLLLDVLQLRKLLLLWSMYLKSFHFLLELLRSHVDNKIVIQIDMVPEKSRGQYSDQSGGLKFVIKMKIAIIDIKKVN